MFRPGDRVVLKGHWEFEDGIVGTVIDPPGDILGLTGSEEWNGCRRVHSTPKGLIGSYFVVFDSPHDDGSGDGPYSAAEIEEDSLRPLLTLAGDET